MAEISSSIYQFLNPRQITPLDVQGHIQQGQTTARNALLLQELRRESQAAEQVRAQLRSRYAQMGAAPAPGMPQPVPGQAGAVQETVHTPYSSDLQTMLSRYAAEGADVTPTPGARVMPGSGPPEASRPGGMPGQPPSQEVLTPEVIRQVGMIDPGAAMKLEQEGFKRQGDRLKMLGDQNAMVSQVARSILMQDTQQAYEVGVATLSRAGIPTQHLPAMYDRRLVEQYYGMSTDAVTRLQEAQAQHQRMQAELAPQAEARLREGEDRLQGKARREGEEAATQIPKYLPGESEGVTRRNALIHQIMQQRGLTGRPPPDVLQEAENRFIADEGITEAEKTRQREQAQLDVKQPALQRKARTQLGQLERQWQTVEEDVDAVLETLDSVWGQTGIWGAAVVPGTPAYDVRQRLDTIRANVGFDRLQQMREASPTGGALGQVSDSENRLLQATAGSLDPKQSKEQLRQNLQRIKADVKALREDRRKAFESEFGGTAPASGRPPIGAPAAGAVRSPHAGKPMEQMTPQERAEEKAWLQQYLKGD